MNGQHPAKAVVVGVDGSADALRAVRWAVPEARRRRAVLRLVHAFAWTDDRMVGMPGLGLEVYGDRLRIAAQRALTAATAVVSEQDQELAVESKIVLGTPAGVLVEQSRSAELLVVGDRGRGRITSLLAGSVAVAVAAHATCPVVVVRGSADAAGDPDAEALPIVVGVDGTPLSEAALAFAFEAASTRHARLVAVHTWLDALADPEMAPLIDWRGLTEDETVALAERLAGWGEKYPDVTVERVVVEGRAAQVLRDRSRKAQLVVVGSRGHGEFAGFVLGSVSSALVHGSGCPVAVVRSSEE
jgi:nucleotide-binding universal stress UspA family protein